MRIIINERQEKIIAEQILREEYNFIDTQKEMVKKWLKSHFKPMDYEDKDENGYPLKKAGLCALDSNGMPSETLLRWDDGLDRLEAQFKTMNSDKTARRKFLHDIMKEWWLGK